MFKISYIYNSFCKIENLVQVDRCIFKNLPKIYMKMWLF